MKSTPPRYLNTPNEICSIHVRRGDYLTKPNIHPTQTINYYMDAVKLMSPNTLFLVFSDDIGWCKDNFKDFTNIVFIEGNSDYEDLLLMSLCDNNIICNSSFSWWAAWLNQNPNKKVVAPKLWFGSGLNHNTKDITPENWIEL